MNWRALALMALALVLAGCDSGYSERAAAASPKATLSFADYGLSLLVPEQWQSQEDVSGLRWYARPMKSGRPMPGAYLTLLRDDATILHSPGVQPTLESYVEFKLEQESRNAVSHKSLSTDTVSVDGSPGKLVLTEYASKTHQWQTFSLFTMREEQGYTVTATALKADIGKLTPAYRALLNSWAWWPFARRAEKPRGWHPRPATRHFRFSRFQHGRPNPADRGNSGLLCAGRRGERR